MCRLILSVVVVLGLVMSAAGQPVQPKQPQPKSQAEVEAVQAMFNAADADARIKAADNLLTKFADTEFKSLALFFSAVSYQQKNDFDKMVIYAERTLEADPRNYQAMLMLSKGIAQHTREHDLDKEEKLTRAENYAKSAQEAMKDAPKPNPQLTDEQWALAKKDLNAEVREALGMVAMVRNKNDVAVNEFKAAMDTASTPDPATMVRLGVAYNRAGKYDEAIAVLDKAMDVAGVQPAVKQFAKQEKDRATQAKAGGAKPAPAPPAPAQVEIKNP